MGAEASTETDVDGNLIVSGENEESPAGEQEPALTLEGQESMTTMSANTPVKSPRVYIPKE